MWRISTLRGKQQVLFYYTTVPVTDIAAYYYYYMYKFLMISGHKRRLETFISGCRATQRPTFQPVAISYRDRSQTQTVLTGWIFETPVEFLIDGGAFVHNSEVMHKKRGKHSSRWRSGWTTMTVGASQKLTLIKKYRTRGSAVMLNIIMWSYVRSCDTAFLQTILRPTWHY